MRVEYHGTGRPRLAVLGQVHGNEPCGRVAIDHIENRARAGAFSGGGSVLTVVANERAAERHRRTALWADPDRDGTGPGPGGDLNRAYGDADPTAPRYEHRLAAVIASVTDGLPVYDLHSTTSRRTEPFAIVAADAVPEDEVGEYATRVRNTGVDTVLNFEVGDGSGVHHLGSVEVEHLQKGTPQAAAQARRTVDRLVAAHGLTDDDPDPATTVTEYTVTEALTPTCGAVRTDSDAAPGAFDPSEWSLSADGFESVDPGDIIAVRERDGETVRMVADESFTPVLADTRGSNLGYVARPSSRLFQG